MDGQEHGLLATVEIEDDVLLGLDEYCFFSARGEPEGEVFALDYEEAGKLWAFENLREDGDSRLLKVKGPGCPGFSFKWMEVRRERENAFAREVCE